MFINTEKYSQKTDFLNSVMNSLPSIGGLWFPENIKKLDSKFIDNLSNYNFNQIAYHVLGSLLEEENTEMLKNVINKAFNFPIELLTASENLHFLETFHGPTLTFKDFGARFMACYLEEKLNNLKIKENVNILVSTSGDTGSAIASAFYDKKNISVTILYPHNRISKIQELQLTTYNKNVVSYGIDDSFDKCQQFAKRSLLEPDLSGLNFVSANSINLARLLPQCLYYFYSYGLLYKKYGNKIRNKVVFVVPSGNCGNLVGGLIAKRMGLPIKHFIVGQNENDTLVRYLHNKEYSTNDTIQTISNAMDVGDPSNFKRIIYMYRDCPNKLFEDVKGIKIDDNSTLEGISKIYDKFGYIIDPHTSVGYNASKYYMNKDEYHVVISTAHPCKFNDLIKNKIGFSVNHKNIEELLSKDSKKIVIQNNFKLFKRLLTGDVNNITLIGMPGSGKSSVGKTLSKQLSYELIELDIDIENKYKKPIPDLIKELGEDSFMDIEEEITTSINFNNGNKIISTGGSVVYLDKGMKHLKNNNSIIVFLNTEFSDIKKRTNNFTNRGIVFNNKTPEELFEERNILYKKYCDISIYTKGLTIETVCETIRCFMKNNC
jgi:threonine synthase